MGAVTGGALTADNFIYIGTGGITDSLYKISLIDGSVTWAFKPSGDLGDCGMPTYTYSTSDSKYKIVFTVGNNVVGRQDDGSNSSSLFDPIALSGTPGVPYLLTDDDKFVVIYNDTINVREYSGGGQVTGWPKRHQYVSTNADPAVYNNEIYVATTDNKVHVYGFDGTLLHSSTSLGNEINLPLLIDDGTVYVTPDNDRLYALTTSMANKWATRTTPYMTLSSTNTGPAFAVSEVGEIYVATGTNVEKVIDNGTDVDPTISWTYSATGTVNSGPILTGTTVFFGTSGSKYYAITDQATPAPLTGWPITTTGDASTGPWLSGNSLAIFGTTTGKVEAVEIQ
jgi:hypothetical protein